jgi:hypothetical protein
VTEREILGNGIYRGTEREGNNLERYIQRIEIEKNNWERYIQRKNW